MSDDAPTPGWPFAVWIALYGLAGFQALSLEIIWFRLLGVMMKASAFTFGTLLTIFLTGLGAGAAVGSRLLRNVRRPGRAFLLLQAFVGLYAGASILVIVTMLPSGEAASAVWSYLGGYEPVDAAAAFRAIWSPEGEERPAGPPFVRLYVALPARWWVRRRSRWARAFRCSRRLRSWTPAGSARASPPC